SKFNRDAMFERLLKLTKTIETLYLKNLLEAFWNDDEFVSKFKKAPAAKKMHHAYIGGLIEHTLSMARLADKIAEHYQYIEIDRDLLVTGAILHDIGKIREFDYKVKIDYSDEGRLLNHIVIGVQMIEEKLENIKNFPDEQALLIKHMIVSHHGTREFGSPEPPKTIEAVLLNYIDEIDSKVNGIREFIDREDPGEKWTSFHRLLERFFYIGKNKKDLTD
ncbi:MAG: CRISPR-associated endonuclease Cas3'', partial [Deltaproteobacteria bacterium]|nr:CRISPR-associated endonuclease Cas3'' [Deltaproteobacteria bacterium]